MEADLIAWIRSRVPQHGSVELGIGDDAAILAQTSGRHVITTDMLMDGVDFRFDECEPERIGHKALAVNLSDLAAMAATPLAVFVSLAIPKRLSEKTIRRVYDGLLGLASKFSVALAGGDTNSWDGPLAINVTAVGQLSPEDEPRSNRGWLRSSARLGDAIVVTGEFGGSILGRHLDFEPRVAEALFLREHYHVHAATDVSDGLSLDLSHILHESRCGAVVDCESLPISRAAHQLSETSRRTPLDHALGDGEDFELIMTLAPDDADRLIQLQPFLHQNSPARITRIGTIVAEPGLWLSDSAGRRSLVNPTGYQHTFNS